MLLACFRDVEDSGGELATAKARATGTGSRWTKAAFLDAIGSPDDRARATTLFDLQEALDDRRGTKDDYYFGLRPNGGVFFHPYGLRYAPFYLWINTTGTVMCSGLWTNYNAILHDSGFSELAQFLGQVHSSRAQGRPLSEIDISEFWPIALRCADLINAATACQLTDSDALIGTVWSPVGGCHLHRAMVPSPTPDPRLWDHFGTWSPGLDVQARRSHCAARHCGRAGAP